MRVNRIVARAFAGPIARRRAGSVLAAAAFVAAVGCETAGIQRAYMALDAAGARPRADFFTDTQSIWCDVDYSSGRTDLTIDVRIRSTRLWIDEFQTYAPLEEVMAQGEVAGQEGIGITAGFQWVQAAPGGATTSVPYPVGDFVCDVTLDGKSVASLPFTIAFPTCPVPPVAAGVPCLGWVARGSVCPDAFGNSCQCISANWTCS